MYVSPTGTSDNSNQSCDDAGYSSISAAVKDVPSYGTVIVCAGTYHEDVLVDQPVNLISRDATIDARGLENGIQVVSSDVKVKGFTVENANGEGVLVGISSPNDIGLLDPTDTVLSSVTIENNRVVNDNQGFNGTEHPNCKYPGDCGGGIHLNVVSDSVVRGNDVEHNVDGVLLTDDYGPNFNNVVEDNVVNYNVHECGITLPSHSNKAVSFDPTTFAVTGRNPSQGGVYNNTVRDNIADFNGTDLAPPQFGGGGSGSGIGLFGSGPGSAVYENLVIGNEAHGNGLAGIAVHAHHPGGEDMNDNAFIGNDLGTNNTVGDPFDGPPATDFQTTGIAIFSVPAASMVVARNNIHDDYYGIWVSRTVTVSRIDSNSYSDVVVPVFIG